MASTVVEAVYENGVLRLATPIDLAEGTRVEVVVTPRAVVPAKEQAGSAPGESGPRRRTAAEIAAEIAALPTEATDDEFSGRDHDQVLYGERGAR